jgi:putative ABC transport system permease protein
VLNIGSILVRNSLRTLLRKRQRLLLNLLMLSLGGAIFITALNIRREIQVLGALIQQRNNFDIFVGLSETVKRSALEQTTKAIAGVNDAQAYLTGSIERILPDGSHTGSVPVMAVSAGSNYHNLALVSGQWPPPENGIVLSSEALEIWGLPSNPPPPIGLPLRVNVAGHQANWVLAGVMGKVTRPIAYVPYDAYAALTGQMGLANMNAVRVAPSADRQAVAHYLPEVLEQVGYSVLYSDDVPHSNAAQMAAFNIPVYALLGIVALIALVGGLGLSSTLSITVMERRREIGILRSIGADPGMVRRLVLTEGLLIALISLPFAWLLAWPLTLAMGRVVVFATIGFIPPLIYLPFPVLAWSGLVCGLALLSSWMPARQASRLSIREALIYTG